MACRDEDFTGAKANDVRQKLRLERILGCIAMEWRYSCLKKNNERALQMDAQLQAFAAKGKAWQQECIALQQELTALMDMLFTTGCVTPAHWDIVAAGKEFKVNAIFAPSYPRWNWPRTVPYLNLIALAYHQFEESRLRIMYMKRYHDVALEIPKRCAEKEGTGGAVPADAIPVTREHAEERSPAAVEKQLYSTIVTHLRGQRVLGRDWDANSFVDTIFEQIRVDPTDEAKQRAIEIIEELAERWHDGNGHNGDSDDEWDLDEVVSPYGTCDSSAYDRFNMDDDRDTSYGKVLEKVIDSHLTFKDGLFFSRID